MVLAEVVAKTPPPTHIGAVSAKELFVVGQEDPQDPIRFAHKGKAPWHPAGIRHIVGHRGRSATRERSKRTDGLP